MKTIEQQILEAVTRRWGPRTDENVGLKLAEECGEVVGAITKISEGRAGEDDLDKEMGDALIVLSQLAARRRTTLEKIRGRRWKEIKKRLLTK